MLADDLNVSDVMEGAVGQTAGSAEATSYLKECWCIPMKQEQSFRYAVDKGKGCALSMGVCEAVTYKEACQPSSLLLTSSPC